MVTNPTPAQSGQRPTPGWAQIRIVYFAILAASGSYVVVGELLHQNGAITPSFVYVFGAPALVLAIVALAQRARFQANYEREQVTSNARTPLIIGVVCAEAIVLLGFVYRFLGGAPKFAYGFYAVGFFLFLLLFPGNTNR